MHRIAASLGSVGLAAVAAERLPTAFHEAGHATVATHFAEAGVPCDNGWCGHFKGHPPLLRYATITPRVTPKGQNYLGETKLTARWRHMSERFSWTARSPNASPPVLVCGELIGTAQPQTAILGLARITYLMGGRAAEERLGVSITPWTAPGSRSIHERVARLLAKPSTATGDLRKSRQVAQEALPSVASTGGEKVGVTPVIESALQFADAILDSRWSAVCVLSGALFVRGYIDGPQHVALLRHHQDASRRSPGDTDAGNWLLDTVASFPFLYGALAALMVLPAADPSLRPDFS